MLDISFTGGYVTVSAPAMGTTTISEFSDEGSPVEVDEIEVTGHSINLNGTVIRWRKPTAYTVKVTVIPLSENDVSLTKLLLASKVEPTGSGVRAVDVASLTTKMEIAAPAINKSGQGGMRTWTLTEGCILGGSPAVASDAEGKMQSKTYSFVFERMTHNNGKGRVLKAGQSTLG